MFEKILIGVDGLQGGRDAIALAVRLAAPEAELTLAHIEAAPVGAVTRLDRTRSEGLLRQEREVAGIEAQLMAGFAMTVGGGLHEMAEDLGADLLVVGSSHRGRLGRVVLGDDCVGALNGASCAIGVASRGYAGTGGRFRTIGVGHDYSAESRHALDVARALAERYGARLKVFHVVSLPEVTEEKPVPADWPAEIDTLTERNAGRLRELGDVEPVVSYGGPGEELASGSGEVDLMVVGSRGFGPVERVFHGSVSHYLVQHARSPVLVLPRPQDAVDELTPAGEVAATG